MGIFKAYDIRGTVPDQLNPDVAFAIGWAFATHLAEDGPGPLVRVGMDARPTSPALTRAFMDGLAAAGATPEFIGPCTTPMLYWAVAGHEPAARGGAMITASHNPARYNGVKLCREDAIPIASTSGLEEIEALTAQAPPRVEGAAELRVNLAGDGQAPPGFDADMWKGYARHIATFARRTPEDLSVAVDTANGMGGAYLGLLRSLGIRVHAIHGEFDGTFPSHEANPSKRENLAELCELVKARGCQAGIALDGDADRAVFIDEKGRPVGQDMITALLAVEVLRRHKGAAVLYDLRSSRAVPEAISEAGGRAVRERVGHSFMKATMRKVGCVLGGELAGHYYFKDNWFADSAIIAVLEVLGAMGRTGEPLSALVKPFQKYAQSGEVNFRVGDTAALFATIREQFKDAQIDELDGVTVQYPDWWFNLRGSNTEPLVRLNLEAANENQLKEKFAALKSMIGEPT